jgi:hypothetical protein
MVRTCSLIALLKKGGAAVSKPRARSRHHIIFEQHLEFLFVSSSRLGPAKGLA